MAKVIQTEKYSGLSEKQAKLKLEKEGFNELPSSKPKSIMHIIVGVVKEPCLLYTSDAADE